MERCWRGREGGGGGGGGRGEGEGAWRRWQSECPRRGRQEGQDEGYHQQRYGGDQLRLPWSSWHVWWHGCVGVVGGAKEGVEIAKQWNDA